MSDQTPSSRRHERTRESILQAAQEIILEDGLLAFSMRKLAEKVDYSPAALYKYFTNKEEILEELRQQVFQMEANFSAERMQGNLPPDALLIESGLTYLEFSRSYPQYYELMMSAGGLFPANMDEFFEHENFKGMIDLIENGVKSGDFRLLKGFDAKHTALLFWFLPHAISTLRATLMHNCPDEFEKQALEVMMALVQNISVTKA
ncbi:MAG: TetR/AcrR family transcriptional regulator [Anaerolineaceae bacterium]|nr:TetR/AcrR family transcriptional regulator [Anaerolineaceae bacterium]